MALSLTRLFFSGRQHQYSYTDEASDYMFVCPSVTLQLYCIATTKAANTKSSLSAPR